MSKKPERTPDWERQLSSDAELRPQFKAGAPRPHGKRAMNGQSNITFFLAISTRNRLKEIALARGTSLQQLLAEALDDWLANNGEPGYKFKDQV